MALSEGDGRWTTTGQAFSGKAGDRPGAVRTNQQPDRLTSHLISSCVSISRLAHAMMSKNSVTCLNPAQGIESRNDASRPQLCTTGYTSNSESILVP